MQTLNLQTPLSHSKPLQVDPGKLRKSSLCVYLDQSLLHELKTFQLVSHLSFSFYQLPNEEILFRRVLNPMCEVFPRVASCTYWKYGTGGQAIGLQESCV